MGELASLGERRGTYRVLVGKAEGKRSLGRANGRWEDNIKMCVLYIMLSLDWLDLALGQVTGFW